MAGPGPGRAGYPPEARGGVRALPAAPTRPLRRPPQRVADDVVGAVGCVLQRALPPMGGTLRHAGVAVAQDRPDLVINSAAV